jgi:3-phosphoglycerate kinase
MNEAINYAEDKTGKKLIRIDTPIVNVNDSAAARKEAEATIKQCAKTGATFCFLHHSSAEELVDKNKRELKRINDYTSMIRDAGMIPGLSAHMPELITFSDANNYDVETYIQIFNCMGFLMQIEIETIASIIHNAKKPVMTIKPMAAGRVTPYVGLTFNWNALRKQDMVTVGCFSEREVHEDVEISFAALEGRFPDLEKRASPNINQSAFGN